MLEVESGIQNSILTLAQVVSRDSTSRSSTYICLTSTNGKNHSTVFWRQKMRLKVKETILRIINNSYTELRNIEDFKSLMYYFRVPKGEDDIRMVYKGSKSGLNKSIFTSWFNLPSSETMARWILVESWQGGNNMEDCWLNHEIHPSFQKYCGIDTMFYFPKWKDMMPKYW